MASMPKFQYHRRHCTTLRKFINPTIPLAFHRCVARDIVKTVKYHHYHLPYEDRKKICLPAFRALIHHPDTNIVLDSVSAIKHLTRDADNTQQIMLILDSGVVPSLVSLLSIKHVEIQADTLNALSNLAKWTDEQAQVVLDYGALSHVGALLSRSDSDRKIIMTAFWFLSNITAADTEDQIQAVIDEGLLPDMIRHLDTSDGEIQRDGVEAVGNIVLYGNKMRIKALLENGVVQPLCNILTNFRYPYVIEVALSCINRILELMIEEKPRIAEMIKECGGVDKMNVVINNSKSEIEEHPYHRDILSRCIDNAGGILQQYFNDESNTDQSNDEVPSSSQ